VSDVLKRWGAKYHDGMIVAGVVIETIPGRASGVADRLGARDDLEIVELDGDRRIAGVWSAPSGDELEKTIEACVKKEEEVLGVFPTFVGADDEG